MESHGLPGEIQVTERAFEALEEGFEFRPRGMIEVKGKGPMFTYLLVGRERRPGYLPDGATGTRSTQAFQA